MGLKDQWQGLCITGSFKLWMIFPVSSLALTSGYPAASLQTPGPNPFPLPRPNKINIWSGICRTRWPKVCWLSALRRWKPEWSCFTHPAERETARWWKYRETFEVGVKVQWGGQKYHRLEALKSKDFFCCCWDHLFLFLFHIAL